jgi:WD40 repeat protein
MYHRGAIENTPLQIYVSALLFSPVGSLTGRLFMEEEPKRVTVKPAVGDKWSACLQTLEGHSKRVWSVTFSLDSTQLASASSDRTIKTWDTRSGKCLQTLNGHSNSITSVTF